MYAICEEGFLLCNKPAIWTSEGYGTFDYIVEQGYPYITKDHFPALKNHEVIFFQNEVLRNKAIREYLIGNENMKRFSPAFHYAMGHMLGLPPKAIDYFIHCDDDEVPMEHHVSMKYCGVECVGSMYDLVDNVTWLWNQYPYPELDIVQIKTCHVKAKIPFQDKAILFELISDHFKSSNYKGAS